MRKAILVLGVIWVLCLAIVAATVDTIPDPPAVKPHPIDVRVNCPIQSPGVLVKCSHCNICFETPRLVRWVLFQSEIAAKHAVSLAVLTPQAADPSPPLLSVQA